MNSDVPAKKTICRYFLRREFKHGAKGKECNFDHPPLCNKFVRNGTKYGGCKKSNCKYFHPRLCQTALKTRVCTKSACSLFHVIGTKRELEKANYEIRSSAMYSSHEGQNSSIGETTPYARAVLSRPKVQMERPSKPLMPEQDNQISADFLFLKNQMQELKSQMSQLTAVVANLQREGQCCPRTGRHI